MALLLKAGVQHISRAMSINSGVDIKFDSVYAIVGRLEFDVKRKVLAFNIDMYANRDVRESTDKGPIDTFPTVVEGEAFDEVMKQVCLRKACYQLVSGKEEFANFESDEE